MDDEKVAKLSSIILASKEATGKMRMLLDVLHSEAVTSADCRTVLSAVAGQLSECSMASRLNRLLALLIFSEPNLSATCRGFSWPLLDSSS